MYILLPAFQFSTLKSGQEGLWISDYNCQSVIWKEDWEEETGRGPGESRGVNYLIVSISIIHVV